MPMDLRLLCVRGASTLEVAARVEALLAGTSTPAEVCVGGPLALTIVGSDVESFRAALASALPSLKAGKAIRARGVFFEPEPKGLEGLAFVFPGQGSQATGMLLGLRGVVPGFESRLAALDAIEAAKGGAGTSEPSLLALVDRPRTDSNDEELRDTRRAQPALGLVSLAIAESLVELGAEPRFTAGHSYGELAALAIAGAWDHATFMRASRARGSILAEAAGTAPGAMAAVFAPRALVETLVDPIEGVVLANLNGPQQCVVSGDSEAIAQLEARARGVRVVRLRTACAFHSPKMAAAVAPFRALLDELVVSPPRIETYANVTAAPHGRDVSELRELLAQQIVAPVRWAESVEAMYAAGARVFVETGPGRVLTGLVTEILGARPHLALAVDPGTRPPAEHFLELVAALVAHGVPLTVDRIAQSPRLAPPPEPRFVQSTGHIVARYFEQQANLVALCKDAPAADRRALVEQALAANERIIVALLEGQGSKVTLPQMLSANVPPEPARSSNPPGSEGWMRARIAELTGFPPETIQADSDFESDLGLDSLTRTELEAALVDAIPAVQAHKTEFRACRTVGDVVVLVARVARAGNGVEATEPGPRTIRDEIVERFASASGVAAVEVAAATDLEKLGLDPFAIEDVVRGIVAAHPELAVAGRELVHAGSIGRMADLATRVLGAETGPGAAEGAELERLVRTEAPVEGSIAELLPRRVVVVGSATDPYVAALSSELEKRGARPELVVFDGADTASLGRALGDGDVPGVLFVARGAGDWATALFVIAKALADQRGAGWLGVITDGTPEALGARGVARGLSREWPSVRVRSVVIETAFDAARALDAVAAGRSELDLVMREGKLFRTRLVPSSPLTARARAEIPRHGVVVVLGGGDGIGAESAVGIARRFGLSIATIGRTALPSAAAHAPEGEELRARARRVGRERALVAVKQRVLAAGVSFQHVTADATDRAELARAFDTIRAAGQPIVGVVHAIGATEDALLGAKSLESFRRVLDTKARSIHHLRELTAADPLAFALVFSSLAAHTGTAGQTDYIAANEIVGATAGAWNAEVAYPVRALLWAVWSEAGLASAALKRQMARLGLPGITNARGVAALLDEIERGSKGEPWVVLSPRATLDFASSPQLLGGSRA